MLTPCGQYNGARGTVVGEHEEVALRSTGRLGVELQLGPRPVNAARRLSLRGRWWRGPLDGVGRNCLSNL